jgi:hypothetical protein
MSRFIQLTALALVTSLAVRTDSASAQLVAMRHHSTILGDHFSGASELVRAQGSFLRDEADAAETWVRVAAASDDLQYQRVEHVYQVKQMRVQYLRENAAARLLQSAQRGMLFWPKAMQEPRFATSLSTIESLLRNWSPDDATGDVYRRALATEAGVLRERIANDLSIDHASRAKAVETLQHLQVLASLPSTSAPAANLPASQLALR